MKQFLSILVGVIIIGVVVFLALRSGDGTKEVVVSPSLMTPPTTQNDFTEQVPPEDPEAAATPSTSPLASIVNISIDDEGFTPATVTVPVGTTVLFTNNGQALHWPASDPHPAHTGLAGFDAKKGLATGATYSHTFTKSGTFGMHDHLNASVKGSIIVK